MEQDIICEAEVEQWLKTYQPVAICISKGKRLEYCPAHQRYRIYSYDKLIYDGYSQENCVSIYNRLVP